MRSITESGVKLLSKIPKIPFETDWVMDRVEKMAVGCKGYVKIQSGRISRGRMTMTDMQDEKRTSAWSEQVYKKDGGKEEWPEALRPRRPEQITLRRWTIEEVRNQKRQRRTRPPMNPEVDIENPPVFLTIKDLKEMKGAAQPVGSVSSSHKANPAPRPPTPKRHRTPSRQLVRGPDTSSPVWPAALLTYERSVSPIDGPHNVKF